MPPCLADHSSSSSATSMRCLHPHVTELLRNFLGAARCSAACSGQYHLFAALFCQPFARKQKDGPPPFSRHDWVGFSHWEHRTRRVQRVPAPSAVVPATSGSFSVHSVQYAIQTSGSTLLWRQVIHPSIWAVHQMQAMVRWTVGAAPGPSSPRDLRLAAGGQWLRMRSRCYGKTDMYLLPARVWALITMVRARPC